MNQQLLFVTGAPGSGKSTTLAAMLKLNSEYLVLDIDWLIDSSSELSEKNLYTDSSAWPAYGRMWFDVLRSICRNSIQPLFFCPNSPSDIEEFGKPTWCTEIHWLLLDCSDAVRSKRLSERQDWGAERRREALADAAELRQSVSRIVDTSDITSSEVASKVLRWADEMMTGN
ncbi:MAG: hypothetical protein JJ956_06585 [Pseudomonadales bacterium]|nr:hypothetical protein [Pseudomonadales bacterium]